MLINCKYCNSKFAINAEEVGFDGRLVKCENCQKEWFQESKPKFLEKKLIELDRSLHATELHLIEQKNNHNDKIAKLENALKVKKEELAKQKLLEERISLFEKRITDTEKEIAAQSLVENRITQLEKEIKQNSFDSFVKNTNLEKKANYLQRKIHSEGVNDRLDNLENDVLDAKENIIKNEIADSEKPNSVKEIKKDIDSKKSKKFFFWNRKKNNKAPPAEKNLDSGQSRATDPSAWDLSEETLERELRELKKQKQNS